MNKAFMYGAKWNPEVHAYLKQFFTSSKEKPILKYHFSFINGDIYSFNGVTFGINAAGHALELSCNQGELEKLGPIVSAFQEWEEFKKHENHFIFQKSDSGSVTVFFNCGTIDTIQSYRKHFRDY